MELKLSEEEVQEIVKKYIEADFGHVVSKIESAGYGSQINITLGEKKQPEPVKWNHPLYSPSITPNTSGTPIPRDTFISSNFTGDTIIKGAQVGISELKSATYAYDGADTPASKPFHHKGLTITE